MPRQSNYPALWRATTFFTSSYPVTAVATTQAPKQLQIDVTKYLTTESLSRVFIRVHGSIVKSAGAAGTASGNDNPGGLLVSVNVKTSPQFANVVPVEQVSARGLRIDGLVDNGDFVTETAITDTASSTQNIDQFYEIVFKRSNQVVFSGIEYSLPLSQFRQVLMTLTFGGRDQLFTGGAITWDLSGLSVEVMADLDISADPQFIHSHSLFENVYSITASNTDFKIDTLPVGFMYTDLFILTEEANALADGILNNVSIQSGGQVWLPKGEGNASFLRRMFLRTNNRILTNPNSTLTGIYAIPIRDERFTRAMDARFSPLTISLDVVAGAATQVRLVGRRIVPAGIYTRPQA